MPDLQTTIWIHVLAAIPPTLAAVAAVIASLRTKQQTSEIHVLVNGERARLMAELAQARAELEQRQSEHL